MDGSTDQSTSPDTTQQKDSASNDTGVMDTGTDATDGGTCMGYDAAGLDDASVQAGLALGLVLSGKNTSPVEGGAIYPPNLTSDLKTGLGCWTNDQILRDAEVHHQGRRSRLRRSDRPVLAKPADQEQSNP